MTPQNKNIMKSSVSIDQFIQEKCRTFSYDWFEKIREEFKSRSLYSPEKEGIFDGIPDFDHDGNTIYINIEIDLRQYSWNNYLALDKSYHEHLDQTDQKLNISGKEIFQQLTQGIKSKLRNKDPQERLNILSELKNWICDVFEDLVKEKNDKKYNAVLDYILKKGLAFIKLNYSDDFEMDWILTQHKSTILFNQSQRELIFLLNALVETNIVSKKSTYELPKLARQYFSYFNKRVKHYVPYDKDIKKHNDLASLFERKDIGLEKLKKSFNDSYNKIKSDSYETPRMKYTKKLIDQLLSTPI